MKSIKKNLQQIYSLAQNNPDVSLFLIAFGLRIALLILFSVSAQPGGDFSYYADAARSILDDGGVDLEPRFIAPGYSIWLALIFSVSTSLYAVAIGDAVLLGLLVVGVYKLATHAFSKQIGWWASIITALWPVFITQVFHHGQGLILYTTLLIWAVYYFYLLLKEKGWRYGLISGALVSWLMLTDPIGFLVPVILLVWGGLVLWKNKSSFNNEKLKRAGAATGVFLLTLLVLLSGWSYRNTFVPNGDSSPTPLMTKKFETKVATQPKAQKQAYSYLLNPSLELLLKSAKQMVLFPFNMSIMSSGHVSHKQVAGQIMHGNNPSLSTIQWVVMGAKIIFTLFHWLLLVSVIWALIRNRKHELAWLVLLMTSYVYFAVTSFAAYHNDGLAGLTPPSAFLVPVLPIMIILAVKLWIEKLDQTIKLQSAGHK
jgi:4-amino-4-deoxy-L-arabinose transferase-like glycosyltransferase